MKKIAPLTVLLLSLVAIGGSLAYQPISTSCLKDSLPLVGMEIVKENPDNVNQTICVVDDLPPYFGKKSIGPEYL